MGKSTSPAARMARLMVDRHKVGLCTQAQHLLAAGFDRAAIAAHTGAAIAMAHVIARREGLDLSWLDQAA